MFLRNLQILPISAEQSYETNAGEKVFFKLWRSIILLYEFTLKFHYMHYCTRPHNLAKLAERNHDIIVHGAIFSLNYGPKNYFSIMFEEMT